MDYQTLIDAPTWAFIRASEVASPPDAAALTIADQRRIYDAMCRAFHQGYPPGVTAADGPVVGVPCRIFPGALPNVLYLHGGGFVVGGLESHADICAEIRARTGFAVVCAGYRLAPEHPHPAAYDDALAVARALLAEGPLLLAGDSAGGNLAAAVCHALRADPGLRGQVLIYPGLGGDRNAGSCPTHAHAPILTRDDVLFYAGIAMAGRSRSTTPAPRPCRTTIFPACRQPSPSGRNLTRSAMMPPPMPQGSALPGAGRWQWWSPASSTAFCAPAPRFPAPPPVSPL